MGAAISLLLGPGIATLITGALAYRRFGSLVRMSMLVRMLVAAAAVGLLSTLWRIHGPLVLVKLALLGMLYLLVLYGLGEITKKDFQLLRRSPNKLSA